MQVWHKVSEQGEPDIAGQSAYTVEGTTFSSGECGDMFVCVVFALKRWQLHIL